MVKLHEGSVPVAVAARVYGKDPCWIRAGIIDDSFIFWIRSVADNTSLLIGGDFI